MSTLMQAESTLTDRYQTTVPESVRRQLGLSKRDKIQYEILSDGAVLLRRASAADEGDQVLGKFLEFLAQDMAQHPEHLQQIDKSLVQRVQGLVAGVSIDLDAPLLAEDE
jgi:antitoxin PrlF